MNHITIFLLLLFLSYLAVYLLLKLLNLPMAILKILVIVSVVLCFFTVLLLMTGSMEKFQFFNDLFLKVVEILDYIAQKLK